MRRNGVVFEESQLNGPVEFVGISFYNEKKIQELSEEDRKKFLEKVSNKTNKLFKNEAYVAFVVHKRCVSVVAFADTRSFKERTGKKVAIEIFKEAVHMAFSYLNSQYHFTIEDIYNWGEDINYYVGERVDFKRQWSNKAQANYTPDTLKLLDESKKTPDQKLPPFKINI